MKNSRVNREEHLSFFHMYFLFEWNGSQNQPHYLYSYLYPTLTFFFLILVSTFEYAEVKSVCNAIPFIYIIFPLRASLTQQLFQSACSNSK